MNGDLSTTEREQLRKLQKELQAAIAAGREATVRWPLRSVNKQVLTWCVNQDLVAASAVHGSVFHVDKRLLSAIEHRLALLGYAPLSANLATSSLAQAQLGAAEHKAVRENPRSHRVLRYLGNQPQWEERLGEAANNVVLDVDQRSLNLTEFTALVVVENLDCFYALADFQLPLSALAAGTALLVYRGDSHYGSASKTLIARWQAAALGPLGYFGDLDPKGLQIALCGGFSHIAVPELAWFVANATAGGYPAKQVTIARSLAEDGLVSGALADYFCLMQRKQRGVLQQWLQQTQLQWLALKN